MLETKLYYYTLMHLTIKLFKKYSSGINYEMNVKTVL